MTQQSVRFEEGVSQVLTVEIELGMNESGVIDVGSARDFGFVLPESFSGDSCAIHVGLTIDGPFYSSGVTFGPSAGAPQIEAADRETLRPFRFFKLVSNANPVAISPTDLESDGILAEGATVLDLKTSGALAAGVLTGGDVLTIDGETYTVVGGPFAPDELDDTTIPNVVVTPGLASATTDGQAVTVTTNPNRGEAAARSIMVATKD